MRGDFNRVPHRALNGARGGRLITIAPNVESDGVLVQNQLKP